MPTTYEYDCVVVGSGHAGSCAALALADAGVRRILIVDKCPEEWAGGNGYFTAGAHRTVHNGVQDLLPIVQNVSLEMASCIDIDPYSADEFREDIMRLGDGKPDKELVQAVVDGSWDAIQWLANCANIPFTLSFNRQAYLVNGRQRFWGGMALNVQDGGKGLIRAHRNALQKNGIETWFNTAAEKLLQDEEGQAIRGLTVRRNGVLEHIRTPAIILASGGYEANPELRKQYLGVPWVKAKVRGTPYNTGDGMRLAKAIGAAITGDFSSTGCHSTCWNANAPDDRGDRVLSNQFTKSGYPLGLMLNAKGERFVDEGADFRNYTYAKFGRAILHQPGGYAFQIWDSQAVDWLRKEEYADEVVRRIPADTIDELAHKLRGEGLEDKEEFVRTIREYNEAVQAHRQETPSTPWNPAVKDGLSTQSAMKSLKIPKSNWALPIEQGPFLAVKVACGITFTFGGLKVDPGTAGVMSETTQRPIQGLYCCGELVGGLFYSNYPGGSGLTAGAVLGRIAGREVAKMVATRST